MVGSPEDVLQKLQEAGRKNLGDFMTFEVGPDDDHPEIQNDGMQYDGRRFRAECKLAGKVYGQRFGVDVAFGDPIPSMPTVSAPRSSRRSRSARRMRCPLSCLPPSRRGARRTRRCRARTSSSGQHWKT